MQVLESCVKNCGSLVHEEIATRPFMEELRDLLKHTTDDNTKQKILEMLQTWGMAFRNSPRYRIVTVSHLTTGFWGKEAWRPTPKMEYQVFLCIFQKNSAMATLGLKEMGKFLWECREKGLPCWLSQFGKIKLRQPTGQTFFPTFPKEFSHFL